MPSASSPSPPSSSSPSKNNNNNTKSFSALELPARADITLQLARGLELVRRHNWKAASIALTNALDLDPSEPKALEHRARCFMMLGQMPSALEDAERLVKVDKKRNAARVERLANQSTVAQQKRQAKIQRQRDEQIQKQQQQLASSPSPTSPTSAAAAGGGVSGNQENLSPTSASSSSSSPLRKFATAARAIVAIQSPLGKLVQDTRNAPSSPPPPNQQQQETEEESLPPKKMKEYHSPLRFLNAKSTLTRQEFTDRLTRGTGTSVQRSRNFLQQAKSGGALDSDSDSGNEDGAAFSSSYNKNEEQQQQKSKYDRRSGSPSPSAVSPSSSFSRGSHIVEGVKYYHGILLRAQVLFMMGCFEEACRQFHEGQRERPDVSEFSTGVAECEQILLGAVHPWRKRHVVSKGVKESLTSSARRPDSAGGASSSSNSSSSHPGGGKQQQKLTKEWRPPRKQLSQEEKELRQCMPEMSDDIFFLKSLRQHPRIFDTGLGPGIVRDHSSAVTRHITRQLHSARNASSQNNSQNAFNASTNAGSSFSHLSGRNSRSGGNTTNMSNNGKIGVGSAEEASVEHRFDHLFQNNAIHSGPAQLAAFCAAAAVESSEEETRKRQHDELLAHAEEQAARAAKLAKSDSEAARKRASAQQQQQQADTGSHGMFGAGGIPEDDDEKKHHRDFHVRPPDTRSWNVQSARGRRRMKDGVDTTLKYLDTQKHFWAHRDERTCVPSLDEPDLPPRFRPDSALSRPGSGVGGASSSSSSRAAEVPFSSSRPHDPFRPSSSSSSTSRRGSVAVQRRRSTLRIPLRQVTTWSADSEKHFLEMYESRRGSVLSNASTAAPSCSGGASALRKTFPNKIKENSEQEEEIFASAMHEVIKLMADQHNAKIEGAYSDGTSSLLHRSRMQRQERKRLQQQDTDADANAPKITSGEYQFIRNAKDDISSCVLAVPSHDSDIGAPPPVFVSENLRNVHMQVQLALSRGAAEVTQSPASAAAAAAQQRKDSAAAGGLPGSSSSSSCTTAGMSAAQKAMTEAKTVKEREKARKMLEEMHQDDLARIHLALFEGSNDPSNNNNNLGMDGNSPPRAVTLKWGEYDGLHIPGASENNKKSSKDGDDGDDAGVEETLRKISNEKQAAIFLEENPTVTFASLSGSSSSSSEQKKEQKMSAAAKKSQARQFARHQRARALLAQHVQKELGVQLPYEAIFRVPQKPSRPPSSSSSSSSSSTTTALSAYNSPFGNPAEQEQEKLQKQKLQQREKSPTAYVQGRDYATVSVKGSPPQRSWQMRPDGAALMKTETESRQQEIEKAMERKRQKDLQEKRSKKRKERTGDGDSDEMEEVDEEVEEEVEEKQIGPRGQVTIVKKKVKTIKKVQRKQEKKSKKKKGGGRRSRSRSSNDDDSDWTQEEEEEDDHHQNQHFLEQDEDEDYDEDDDDDDDDTSDGTKTPPLTLDEVRSQYSRAAKKRLSIQGGGGASGGLFPGRPGGVGGSSRNLSRTGSRIFPSASTAAFGGGSDDDMDTSSDDSYDLEEVSDASSNQSRDGAGGGDESAYNNSDSLLLLSTSSSPGTKERTAKGVADAISAAKAILVEHQRASAAPASAAEDEFGGTGAEGRKSIFELKIQQRKEEQQKKENVGSGSGSGLGFTVTSGTKHESVAMRKLNATLRNISRLCALGDVPQAISIAAALVKELEAGDTASSSSSTTSTSPSTTTSSSSSSNRKNSSAPTASATFSSFHLNPGLLTLAAKLRCTLGGLYLEIGEGAAAVAELSRAVLLAKRSAQTEIYEQAVKLLGECYQTSGEDVADNFENAANRVGRKGRAASVISHRN